LAALAQLRAIRTQARTTGGQTRSAAEEIAQLREERDVQIEAAGHCAR
jgi:hypothetical protein